MKNNFILISALILFIMISCTHAPKESGKARIPQRTQEPERQLKADDFVTTAPGSTVEAPVVNADSEVIVLNPPHGQPGHSCDIPVGSPLIAQNPSPAPQVRNTSFAPTVENAARLGTAPRQTSSATSSTTTVRLNPPHGQPGHRCEIPVGSPLN
jgi:hypothetical protein